MNLSLHLELKIMLGLELQALRLEGTISIERLMVVCEQRVGKGARGWPELGWEVGEGIRAREREMVLELLGLEIVRVRELWLDVMMLMEIVGRRRWHDGTLFLLALATELLFLFGLLEHGFFGADLSDVTVALEVILLTRRTLQEEVLAETLGSRMPYLGRLGSGDPAFLVATLSEAPS